MLDRDIKRCVREVGGKDARSVEEVMCPFRFSQGNFQLQSDRPILPPWSEREKLSKCPMAENKMTKKMTIEKGRGGVCLETTNQPHHL